MVERVLEYVQYAVLVLLVLLAVDLVLDWVRRVFGRPKNERLAKALQMFDGFCDQLRRIVGEGPLGQLTRESVEAMAGIGYDLAREWMEGVWSREEWVEAVLRWYDEQMEIERVAEEAYARTVPGEVRRGIAARARGG